MAQFDVFVNPNPRARSTYPYVVSMQSEIFADAATQIVAPTVSRDSFPKNSKTRRLTPSVEINAKQYLVLVSRLALVRSHELNSIVSSLSPSRNDLLSAVDLLFFGV